MKRTLLITAIVLGMMVSGAFAEERRGPKGPSPHRMRTVTPYGDFCPSCSVYGVRYKHEAVKRDKAVEAIRVYFKKRGFRIGNVKGMGRFIKVDVFRQGKLVDRVVFDRKTGRIRSIY